MGVGSSLRLLGKLSKVADDVVEAGAKTATKANVMKNVTTSLTSNMTKGNMRAMANAGDDMVRAVKNNARNAADDVINARTAQKALDNFNSSTTKEVAESMVHPEVAATYTRGGGSRGRGGNGGYNNRNNYNRRNNVNYGTNKQDRAKEVWQNAQRNKQNASGQSKHFHTAQAESTLDVAEDIVNTTTVSGDDINSYINNMEGPRSTRVDNTPRNTTYSYVDNPPIKTEPVVEPQFNTGQTGMRFEGPGPNTNRRTTGNAQPDANIGDVIDAAEPQFMSNAVEPQFNTSQTGMRFEGSGPNTNKKTTGNAQPDANIGGVNNTVEPQFDIGGGNQQRTRGNSEQKKTSFNFQNDPKFEEAKQAAGDFFFGGIKDTYSNIVDKNQGFFEALGNAHMQDGNIRWGRAAGTFMTASAAARIATGGGLYKDRYGNPNLIGVPFI